MRYIFSFREPQSHYIDIEFCAGVNSHETLVKIPAWRPGRYEIGNFVRNVQKWKAFDEQGKELVFRKTDRDTWRVDTKGVKELHVKYNYYAAEINAGSSFLDETQLYVNPVNCCLYIPGRLEEKCDVELLLPDGYKVACSMAKKELKGKGFLLSADDFHELADSPFVASPDLKHTYFVMDGVEYNLWFQGECRPEWPRIVNDFFIFINEQFLTMKEFPVPVYHFIFQALPYRFYHGVEHLASTVIALGPSYDLFRGETYEDLLGVSSHELFHAWNVKSIRPSEMMPYDYSGENYSRLGFVYEGVTTYYGDLFLYRSGVFSTQQYFKTFNERLQKHFDNGGRLNMPVAEASFDTWVDGYVPGVPDRKTSIYDEGCLAAFITDILIREHTGQQNSLDDVMRLLYYQHAKNGMGYSEQDYLNLVNQVAGTKLDEVFRKYIYGCEDFTDILKYCLDLLGLRLVTEPSPKLHERKFGFKISPDVPFAKVSSVMKGAAAYRAGLRQGDEIFCVNGMRVNADLDKWLSYFAKEKVTLEVFRSGVKKELELPDTELIACRNWKIGIQSELTADQQNAFNKWAKRPL